MATDKTNNLTAFLEEIASTLREATGSAAKINPQDFNGIIESIIESGGGSGETPVEDLGFIIRYPINLETPGHDPTYRIREADVLSLMLVEWIGENLDGEKVPQEIHLGKFLVDGVEVQEIKTDSSIPGVYILITGNNYGFDYVPSIHLYYEDAPYIQNAVGRIDVLRYYY